MTEPTRQTGILILIDQRQTLRDLLDDQSAADLTLVIANIREGIRLVFGVGSDHLSSFSREQYNHLQAKELLGRLDQLIESAMPLVSASGDNTQLAVLKVLNRLRRDIALIASEGSNNMLPWWDKHASTLLKDVEADRVLRNLEETITDLKVRNAGPISSMHGRRRFMDRWIREICQDSQLVRPKEMKDNKMRDEVDLLLITANDYETIAVLEVFERETGDGAVGIVKSKRTYDKLGTINGTRVYHARSEQGSMSPGAAHDTVAKAVEALKPSAVIAVGIAFGANKDKQAIGQILVSKQIFLYDPKRAGERTNYRGSKPDASPWLLKYFRSFILRSKWRTEKIQAGLILSGESLVDNIALRNELLEREPEAIGGEMEGSGLYVATHETSVAWIIIKAICDWADGKVDNADKEKNQRLAATNAAEFLIQALKNTALMEGTGNAEDSAAGKVESPKPIHSLKRSQPELVALEKPQTIEFHGGEMCNQMVKVVTVLPKLIAFPVERGQWSNYTRVPHLDKDGKHAYSHAGTGSTSGKPQNFAVPVIATMEGGKLTALKVSPDAIRDKVVGLAITPQGRFKIETWGQNHSHAVELGRVIERYDLSEKEIPSALDDLGLLGLPVDGIVTDEIEDETLAKPIKEKLQQAGLKQYFTDSPKAR